MLLTPKGMLVSKVGNENANKWVKLVKLMLKEEEMINEKSTAQSILNK